MSEVYLSREGYQKLHDELRFLKDKERPTVRLALKKARAFGDLSENAEYTAAKERLLSLETRISKLEETLSRTRLIENEDIPDDKVYIGATVELLDLKKQPLDIILFLGSEHVRKIVHIPNRLREIYRVDRQR